MANREHRRFVNTEFEEYNLWRDDVDQVMSGGSEEEEVDSEDEELVFQNTIDKRLEKTVRDLATEYDFDSDSEVENENSDCEDPDASPVMCVGRYVSTSSVTVTAKHPVPPVVCPAPSAEPVTGPVQPDIAAPVEAVPQPIPTPQCDPASPVETVAQPDAVPAVVSLCGDPVQDRVVTDFDADDAIAAEGLNGNNYNCRCKSGRCLAFLGSRLTDIQLDVQSLTKGERDLLILGKVATSLHMDADRADRRGHQSAERKRTRMDYTHEGIYCIPRDCILTVSWPTYMIV